jgi:formylglycine-generating enzyme required for sulfatase activity
MESAFRLRPDCVGTPLKVDSAAMKRAYDGGIKVILGSWPLINSSRTVMGDSPWHPNPAAQGFRRTAARVAAILGAWLLLASAHEPPLLAAPARDRVPPPPTYNTAESLERAIRDLSATFGANYPKGGDYLKRLDQLKRAGAQVDAAALDSLRAEALLANPLLDFNALLLVRRAEGWTTRKDGKRVKDDARLGLPNNWLGNTDISSTGYDNEIAVLSPVSPQGKLATVYRPAGTEFVGDLCLHFDAGRLLFSMPVPAAPPPPAQPGKAPAAPRPGPWQVWEATVTATGGAARAAAPRQVTQSEIPGVQNYNGIYLPNGKILYTSTACNQGVPCVNGSSAIALLYVADADGKNVRQLTFDQDHNWYPAVMNDGRVMFTRWEYSDIPHYFSRLPFQMRPDGTAQMPLYKSNSYWPTAMFYLKPIPNHPTKFAAIVSGHHGVPRMGELVVFDPARGRHEADGVVQRIPGFGLKVEPVIRGSLVDASWPKFLHPWPLSEKHFLVSMLPHRDAPWGLYLVDVFDNAVRIREEAGMALFEPIPLKVLPRPPVLADIANPKRKDAVILLTDVYAGDGLKGVPRGTVKSLRVFAHHYGYHGNAGYNRVAQDGAWDAKRILGTVPVYEDGSAMFRAPANTPLVVQPLDAEGRALQLMRSWMTAMPGEMLSCVGCHEPLNTSPPVGVSLAARRGPVEIEPWRGPARGFSFAREVQPVLDKHCVGCHDGRQKDAAGRPLHDLRRDGSPPTDKAGYQNNFGAAYVALHPYVRRPGLESDYGLLAPLEFHASTSELVQMLRKGHHGVALDVEAWDRLITWIDLNIPYHATWSEASARRLGDRPPSDANVARLRQAGLRQQARELYANLDDDLEKILPIPPTPAFVRPQALSAQPKKVECPGWPWTAEEAKKRQAAAGTPAERTVELPGGLKLDLVPPGEFVMGSAEGPADELPEHRVRIAKTFWMSRHEITNAQYVQFDPAHDSGYLNRHGTDSARGAPAFGPRQPVVRVSWQQAMAFCAWLSGKSGRRFTLPTEAQWEYACRAGTATPFCYGGPDDDFSKRANVADVSAPSRGGKGSYEWGLRDTRFNDGAAFTADVGKYAPNPWGLCDMHGNVAEWTRSTHKPYPYGDDDGRNESTSQGEKVVRGGSWCDRPHRTTSSFRLSYPVWQRVYNVGFRVILEEP